jgi:hypothetical protein
MFEPITTFLSFDWPTFLNFVSKQPTLLKTKFNQMNVIEQRAMKVHLIFGNKDFYLSQMSTKYI